MKSLNTYVIEGLADWSDDKLDKKISQQTTKSAIKKEIIDWLKNNVKLIQENKLNFDFNTTPITVDYDDNIGFKDNITSLTNGTFQWGEVGGYFDCSYCQKLKTLEGAPKKVGSDFRCRDCKSLTSLEGSPMEVGGNFHCSVCKSLISLEGAPKEIRGDFSCCDCYSLKSLEGAPKEVGAIFGATIASY